MNTNKKKYFSPIYILTILTLIIFACVNTTNAYAENPTTTDAQVNNPTTDTSAAQIPTTRRAPVSIAVYSDTVTESADTYIYSNIDLSTGEPVFQFVTATSAPTSTPNAILLPVATTAPTNNVTTTSAPQGTGAPGATEEPDMITYPPTVAPAYQDF